MLDLLKVQSLLKVLNFHEFVDGMEKEWVRGSASYCHNYMIDEWVGEEIYP